MRKTRVDLFYTIRYNKLFIKTGKVKLKIQKIPKNYKKDLKNIDKHVTIQT